MLFSSWTFLLLFLPIVLAGYTLLPVRCRNGFLLVSSLFFYAWGQVEHLVVMLGVICVDFLIGIAIDRWREYGKFLLALAIAANLGLLGWYKYTDFLIRSLNDLQIVQMEPLNIALPVGISFFTFQALSYIFDVYRRVVPVQKSFLKLSLYVALFPQLIAGPIVKYREIMGNMENRELCIDETVSGLRRFMLGLAKKTVIADSMGKIADAIFVVEPGGLSPLVAWTGAIAYSLQIFYDFSGYSDMAIGMGRIFGFTFAENFNYPYISASMTEFWRRWHISLSTWFRDYVYIPLGGNRCSSLRNTFNLFAVFFLTGLWHGANWTYVVWGLWHGCFLFLEKQLWIRDRKMEAVMVKFSGLSWHKVLCHVYTIMVFVFGWVIFRSETLGYALDYLAVMVGMGEKNEIIYGLLYYVNNKLLLIGIAGILLCNPWKFSLTVREDDSFCWILFKDAMVFGAFFLALMFMAVGTYNPFIYFRF